MVGLVYGSQRQGTMCLKRLTKKMAELSHFIFNSDYPTDKLVFMHEGKIPLTSSLSWQYDFVNTHIPIQLYAEGDFKLSGSDDVYPLDGNGNSAVLATLGTFMYQGECWAVVAIAPLSSTVGKTASYRLWAYYDEETSKNTDISMTTNMSKPRLALTSDNNYPRFLGDGYITQGLSYVHNLGFIPLVKTWTLYKNEPAPMPDGTTANVDLYQPQHYSYLGDARNLYGWSGNVVQVSSNNITTYPANPTDPDEPVPSGVYFRMYRI